MSESFEGLIKEIAGLVRLQLTGDEIKKLARDYAGFREHAEKLKEVDTSGVEPATYKRVRGEKLRTDQAQASMEREAFFNNVPDREGDYVKVPRVLKRPDEPA